MKATTWSVTVASGLCLVAGAVQAAPEQRPGQIAVDEIRHQALESLRQEGLAALPLRLSQDLEMANRDAGSLSRKPLVERGWAAAMHDAAAR
ncbi:hypothetical protein SAMN04488068_2167 [Hydrocarboniphaga daqingensis]|uniref:Outer membrane efflux protein n=1 Tax=Hydrocarboniphaga daqingensis TaxID=490188 RepID=A0A1M5PD13_9GAMM|nr:hypothetical protein [Hydrocarboniphaga daqingensis]SHG99628.1 hypothetical protein SAMN04488068_2167 [Hydrocarboniphaga daqingensis]